MTGFVFLDCGLQRITAFLLGLQLRRTPDLRLRLFVTNLDQSVCAPDRAKFPFRRIKIPVHLLERRHLVRDYERRSKPRARNRRIVNVAEDGVSILPEFNQPSHSPTIDYE